MGTISHPKYCVKFETKMNYKPNYKLPFTSKTDNQIVFQSPWHSQLFAITVQLSESGNFSWKEFVDYFGKSLNRARIHKEDLDGNDDYFNSWLVALEEIIVTKEIANSKILSVLKNDWINAYLSTPHGDPVKIKQRTI